VVTCKIKHSNNFKIISAFYNPYVRVFFIANPSVICNVRVSYSGGWTFRNISAPPCTLAILWLPCKILWRCPRGTHPRGVKCKRV